MSKINFPKSITDIAQIIGVGSYSNAGDLGWICTGDSYINQWARYKPTSGGGKLNRATRDDNTAEKRLVTYGLAYYNGNELKPNTNVLGKRITSASNLSLRNNFNLKQKGLKYFRLQDFDGYDHNATFNLTTNYSCFPDETVGNGQTGFFYNRGGTVLRFLSNKTSGLNTTPLVYDGSTNYCSLDVEDIIAESLSVHDFPIGDFKLGVAFVFSNNSDHSNDNLYLFSTGKKIYDLLVPLTPTTYELKFTKDGNEYTLARISCGERSFNFTLSKLTLFEKWQNINIFNSNEYTESIARIVLINTDTKMRFWKDPTSLEVYAFSPDEINGTSFGIRSSFSIKKALSYQNVTSKTDRNNDKIRSAGYFYSGSLRNNNLNGAVCWFDYNNYELVSSPSAQYLSNYYELYNHQYRKTSDTAIVPNKNYFITGDTWRWYFNRSYTEKTTRQFSKQCYLLLEDNGDDVTWQGSGSYKKFRLFLRGYVCHEFRSKYPDNDNESYQYFFGDDDITIKGTGTVTLYPDSNAGNVIIEFKRSGYQDKSKTTFSSSNGITIGGYTHNFRKASPFIGDKAYQNESTDGFRKCCSELIQLDDITYDGVNYPTCDYATNQIYIYVQKSVFSDAYKVTDFFLNMKYNFKVNNEIKPVNEICDVHNASTSTLKIKYNPNWTPEYPIEGD